MNKKSYEISWISVHLILLLIEMCVNFRPFLLDNLSIGHSLYSIVFWETKIYTKWYAQAGSLYTRFDMELEIISGRCVHLWPVPRWCKLGQKELPPSWISSQGLVHTVTSSPYVCHQLHCAQRSTFVPVPYLQEASQDRPNLYHIHSAEN